MKPLDGAKLKIARAQQHLDALEVEIRAYLDTKPYEFPFRQEQRLVKTGTAVITKEPPLELGCIFGDCLNNLRTALEYIAWELYTKYKIPPLPPRQASGIHFPLQKIAADFSSNARPKLEDLAFPAAAIDLIESVQPYQAGYESLGLLNSLVNTDKHKLPMLTIATADTSELVMKLGETKISLIFTDTLPDGAILAKPVDPRSAEGIKVAQTIQEFQRQAASPLLPGEQPGEVKVDGEVTVFVSLKDSPVPREPVHVTLTKIFKCVSDIVPRFEPFLT